MILTTWLAFVLASSVMLMIPGPTIILVITQSITYGKKSVLPLALGVLLGDFVAMTASLLGLGVLMATSATLFGIFKWLGAGYLFYLGIKMWRSKLSSSDNDKQVAIHTDPKALFKQSLIVTALNPKSIAFFVAFMPQFMSPQASLFGQSLILGVTFLLLAVVNAALYGFFAGQLQNTIKNPRVHQWFERIGGTALIGAGVITATLKRT